MRASSPSTACLHHADGGTARWWQGRAYLSAMVLVGTPSVVLPALAVVINAVVDALSEFGVIHVEMPAERVWRAIAEGGRGPPVEPCAIAASSDRANLG